MNKMAFSAHKRHHHHHLVIPSGTTAAPPPTPSSHPNNLLSSPESADALSRLLHRLPPTLSMSIPSRRPSPSSSSTTTTSPPIISLSDPTPTLHSNLFSASQLGFFQLTHHSITSQLANAAESNSLSLFNLPQEQKQSLNPQNWPLGYDADDNNDNDDDSDVENTAGESFILDSSCTTESTTELNLDDLKEFTSKMEKLGLDVIEALACEVGFENPVREDPKRVCSLMWIADNSSGNNKPDYTGRLYPYAIGLQYQIRCQKYSLLSDSGWVSVSPQVDSVLVTLGDIVQVWSNGKMKKVRGRPVPSIGDNNSSNSITMSLLITLPVDSIVSPLIPKLDFNGDEDEGNKDDQNNSCDASSSSEEWVFNSFSFEDYAWRVYHERLLFKDPLVRYRV